MGMVQRGNLDGDDLSRKLSFTTVSVTDRPG